MSNTIINNSTTKINITCDRLPLAVYLEIVSHLRQINGINADLFPQTSQEFDYLQSQVGGLSLEYEATEETEIKVKSILTYYENKYGLFLISNQE